MVCFLVAHIVLLHFQERAMMKKHATMQMQALHSRFPPSTKSMLSDFGTGTARRKYVPSCPLIAQRSSILAFASCSVASPACRSFANNRSCPMRGGALWGYEEHGKESLRDSGFWWREWCVWKWTMTRNYLVGRNGSMLHFSSCVCRQPYASTKRSKRSI